MRELRLQTNKSGACDVQIPIPDYALTGNYIAKCESLTGCWKSPISG